MLCLLITKRRCVVIVDHQVELRYVVFVDHQEEMCCVCWSPEGDAL